METSTNFNEITFNTIKNEILWFGKFKKSGTDPKTYNDMLNPIHKKYINFLRTTDMILYPEVECLIDEFDRVNDSSINPSGVNSINKESKTNFVKRIYVKKNN